jgi:hypothetical protein
MFLVLGSVLQVSFAQSGITSNAVLIVTFGVQEGAELSFGSRPKPGNDIPEDAVVSWTVTLKDSSGEILGSRSEEAPIGGLARFEIATDATSRTQSTRDGIVQILMNDEFLGTTSVRNGRVVLRVEAGRAVEGRNPQTGEPISIAASKVPGFGAWSVFDFASGESRATSAGEISFGDPFTIQPFGN